MVGGYFKKKNTLKRTESLELTLANQSESVDRSMPSFQNWRTEKRQQKLVNSQKAKNEHIRTNSIKRLSSKLTGIRKDLQ